jgi:peptidoglycan-N-acetylglucosamine deacetylase
MCPVRSGSGYDEALIRLLLDQRIPATFFLSGRWVETHADQVKALLAVPFFEIGTHGQAHAHLPLLDPAAQREEIRQAVTLLRSRYGVAAPLFRPPYGEYDDRTVDLVRELGLTFILWDRVSGDPDPRLSSEQIVERLIGRPRNGNIIVFHANGKGRHTRTVVEAVYQELAVKKGLQPVTVSNLLGACRLDGAHGQSPAGH